MFDLFSRIGCKPPSTYTHLIDVFFGSLAVEEENVSRFGFDFRSVNFLALRDRKKSLK